MTVSFYQAWLNFSKANTYLQQFGQSDDESTFNGSTACTHAVLQRLVKAKTGKFYSQDQISTIATYPWPIHNDGMRGMFSGGSDNEVGRVMAHFDLPYVLIHDLSFDEVGRTLAHGPAIVGVRYGYWPEQIGYRYGRLEADGKPGGFAFRNGKTQLAGAERVEHAVLLLSAKTVKGTLRINANEPNHGSASRPERPDYDAIRFSHAERAYRQYESDGRHNFAWVATRTFRPKGF